MRHDARPRKPTARELYRWIVAARREAQRAQERGDSAALVHFEDLITDFNRMW